MCSHYDINHSNVITSINNGPLFTDVMTFEILNTFFHGYQQCVFTCYIGLDIYFTNNQIFKYFQHETLDTIPGFSFQNALKLTYSNVQIQKFSGGYTPGPPLQGRGTKREGGERRERGGRVRERRGRGREIYLVRDPQHFNRGCTLDSNE